MSLSTLKTSLKMSHVYFSILAFFINFCPIKIDLSGDTVGPQTSVFKKLAKWTILNNQNVIQARFARNVVK